MEFMRFRLRLHQIRCCHKSSECVTEVSCYRTYQDIEIIVKSCGALCCIGVSLPRGVMWTASKKNLSKAKLQAPDKSVAKVVTRCTGFMHASQRQIC